MSDKATTMQTGFLTQKRGEDQTLQFVKEIGPKFVTALMRLLKQAELFNAAHQQVAKVGEQLCAWLNEEMARYRLERLSLQFSETNTFLNGNLVRFDENEYVRSVVVRTTFLQFSVNQITVRPGVAPLEFVALVTKMHAIRDAQEGTLEGFKQVYLSLEIIGHKALDELADADERRAVIELYAGLVIKCAYYFEMLKRSRAASARMIKRLLQKITDMFDTHRHVFIGLINLKIIPPQNFVHSVNTALYAMFIGHEVNLDRLDLVRIGMTAITQDIHRICQLVPQEQEQLELGKPSHFQTNMTSVTMLSEMGSTDLLSAMRLVTGYEQGFPYNKDIPRDWYDRQLRPHLLTRIIELAKHYDVLTLGIDGEKGLKADLALQKISERMGKHYDPQLTKLFINLIGIYPVGAMVELSTGERALVVKSPVLSHKNQNKSSAHRPVVRLLDGSGRLMDLSQSQYLNQRILRIIDPGDAAAQDGGADQPGAFFFF